LQRFRRLTRAGISEARVRSGRVGTRAPYEPEQHRRLRRSATTQPVPTVLNSILMDRDRFEPYFGAAACASAPSGTQTPRLRRSHWLDRRPATPDALATQGPRRALRERRGCSFPRQSTRLAWRRRTPPIGVGQAQQRLSVASAPPTCLRERVGLAVPLLDARTGHAATAAPRYPCHDDRGR
jgi:hypothetical protein